MRIILTSALATAAAVSLFPSQAQQSQASYFWQGGTGNWDTISKWAIDNQALEPFFPNTARAEVFIDNFGSTDSNVTVNAGSTYVVGRLLVSDTLNFANESRIRVGKGLFGNSGEIVNDGTINLGGVSSSGVITFGEDLELKSFNGTGALVMGGSQAEIYAEETGRTFTNRATITGSGQIGRRNTNIVNRGLISATSATPLELGLLNNPTTPGNLTNHATLQAASGGTLLINGSGDFDNTNGVLEALDGGTVNLRGFVSNHGGIFRTSGTGVIQTVGSGMSLSDVTNQGKIEIAPSSSLIVGGTINNTSGAVFNLNGGTTGSATLRIVNGTIFSGAGVIELSDSGSNSLVGNATGDTVTIASGATIRGAGLIGSNTASIVNQGTIAALYGTPLEIGVNNNNNSNLANTGTLVARNGGVLKFAGSGNVNNSGGVIKAEDGGTVKFTGFVSASGGTLQTVGTGVIQAETAGGVTLSNITNEGNFVVLPGSTMLVGGTITNAASGVFKLNGGIGGSARVNAINGATFSGPGVVELSNSAANIITGNTTGATFTVASGATIRGAGSVGLGNANLVNQGTIEAIYSTSLLIGVNSGANSNLSNTGILRANQGSLNINGNGNVNNTGGTLEAKDGGSVNWTGFASLTNLSGGTLTGGTYRATTATTAVTNLFLPGNVAINAASIEINGASALVNNIDQMVANQGSLAIKGGKLFTITPTGGAFTNTGSVVVGQASRLTINGSYVQSTTGSIGGKGEFVATTMTLGGLIAPGESPGTLTLSSHVVMTASTTLQFELGSLGGPNDLINISGDLTLDGLLTVVPLSGFTTGTYDLINFGGNFTDLGLDLDVLPPGYTASFNVLASNPGISNGTLQLIVVPEPATNGLSLIGAFFGGWMFFNRKKTS